VIPDEVIEEMCTLVKGNSIAGSKCSEADIVWTPFCNLRKDDITMDTGTVGFNNEKQCWYFILITFVRIVDNCRGVRWLVLGQFASWIDSI